MNWRHFGNLREQIDWSLVILVAAFLIVAPVGTFVGGTAAVLRGLIASGPDPDGAAYEASIAAAAVKHPKYAVKLDTIDPSSAMVDVVTFGTRTPQDRNRTYDVWVALPAQLRNACAGATDPIKRLQQILGLPPAVEEDGMITELRVPRDALFRPCVGGGDLATPKCNATEPAALPESADPAMVREGYDRMLFFATQMWKSYRWGFGSSPGYPFTGMGWTYDWSNVPNHVGVSEFVIGRKPAITIVGAKTPAEFCTAASPK